MLLELRFNVLLQLFHCLTKLSRFTTVNKKLKFIAIKILYILFHPPFNKIKSFKTKTVTQNHTTSNPMIFKLTYRNQIHLYNKNISFQTLVNYTRKIFKRLPQNFTFVYQTPQGQMTYIESDADLIGLKYCCSFTNDYIVKLTILQTQMTPNQSDNDISILNLVKENISLLSENVWIDLTEQTEKEAIEEYLRSKYDSLADAAAQEEINMIGEMIRNYLSSVYESTVRIMESPNQTTRQLKTNHQQNRRIFHNVAMRPDIIESPKSTKSIEELVEQKVQQLIPSIVSKIYQKMEKQLKDKCLGCMKKERSLDDFIDLEIQRKLSITSIKTIENPEGLQNHEQC